VRTKVQEKVEGGGERGKKIEARPPGERGERSKGKKKWGEGAGPN